MRVLVLGGSGLISTGITRQLLARGDAVTLYNRGLHQAAPPAGAALITGDRRDIPAFEAAMATADMFDAVIDMICFEPAEAESALRAFNGRTGQYILCSTVDVYTKAQPSYPVREDAERRPKPSFPYACKKRQCEDLVFAAQAAGRLPITILRPAYTYGEGVAPLHTFGWGDWYLARLRQGKPVVVHGNGRSLWSCCHRDDVARAFVGAAGNPAAYRRAYTVSGSEWLTWDRYHEILAEAAGAPPPHIIHIPADLLGRALPREADWCVENFSYNNIFDTTAAQRDLGFRYTIPWRAGAQRMVRAWDAQPQAREPEPAYYERLLTAWEKLSGELTARCSPDS
ncbi:MAG: NAD-dependent epimerase/dehydratase family protein [Anaerolineae bacterium]